VYGLSLGLSSFDLRAPYEAFRPAKVRVSDGLKGWNRRRWLNSESPLVSLLLKSSGALRQVYRSATGKNSQTSCVWE